jgi:hypothetical protein
VGVWIFYFSGRVKRNVSTAVSVNGLKAHLLNGSKAVEPVDSEGIMIYDMIYLTAIR